MSRENVIAFIAFIAYWDGQGPSQDQAMKDFEPDFIIDHVGGQAFSFSKDDLKSVLNSRNCKAESLPPPWGWSVARKLGLVRS